MESTPDKITKTRGQSTNGIDKLADLRQKLQLHSEEILATISVRFIGEDRT